MEENLEREKNMAKNYSIDISTASDMYVVSFELLKKDTSEYWAYTATRYSGPDTMPLEYHVTEDTADYPVGSVIAEMDPEKGIIWNYTNYPHGTVDGYTDSFKEALRQLTKNA